MRFLFLVPNLTMFLSNKTKNILLLRTLFFQTNLWTNFFRLFFFAKWRKQYNFLFFLQSCCVSQKPCTSFYFCKRTKENTKDFSSINSSKCSESSFFEISKYAESSFFEISKYSESSFFEISKYSESRFFEISKYSESKKHQNILSLSKKKREKKKEKTASIKHHFHQKKLQKTKDENSCFSKTVVCLKWHDFFHHTQNLRTRLSLKA